MVIYAQPGQILHLGHYTSSQQTTIIFDVSAWKDQITNESRVVVYYGLVDKMVTPKTTCYGSTLIDNGYQVSWTVDSDTTSMVGEGRCEVALLEGETHTALSYYWQTVVSNSIYNNDTTTPAEVYENYIDRMGREYDAINALDVTTDWIDYSKEGSVTKEVIDDHLVLNFHLPRAPEFQIRKSYLNLDAMYQDFANCTQYDFCIIDTGNVEEETTAQLYMVGVQPSTGIAYTVSHINSFPPQSPSTSVLYVLDVDVTYQGVLYKKHDGVVWVNNTWVKAYIYLADLSGIKGAQGVGLNALQINSSTNELQYNLVNPATGDVTDWYTIDGASFYTQIATYAANALTASTSAAMWATGGSTGSPTATNNALYYASLASKWATWGSGTPSSENNAKHWATVAQSWATEYSNNNAKYYAEQAEKWTDFSTGGTPTNTNHAKYWADQAHNWATLKANDNASYYASVAHSWANGGKTGTPSSENNAAYYADQASKWAAWGAGGAPTSENNAKYYANQASHFADDADASEKQAAKWVTGTSTPATEPGSTNNAAYYTAQAQKWANFSATGDPTSNNNAKYWADEAQAWANSKPNNNASYYASIARAWANGSTTGSPTNTNNALYYRNGAEAWAVGKVEGTAIGPTSTWGEAYNKHASYYAGQAKAWAVGSSDPSTSPTSTNNASYYANQAKTYAEIWTSEIDQWARASATLSLYDSHGVWTAPNVVLTTKGTGTTAYKEFKFNMPLTGGYQIYSYFSTLTAANPYMSAGRIIAVNTPSYPNIYIGNGQGQWIFLGTTAEAAIEQQKGEPNGIAELDSEGKVLASELPSYVDDVLEYNTRNDFPATGESGKIYIAKDTNVTYRWSGSTYVVIGSDLALGETSSTAYRGDRGKVAYDHATEATRLSTAQTLGFYKVATTAQGHVGRVSAVTASDIVALSLPYMQQGRDYVTAGQLSGTTLATKATAEGYNTTASGQYAHAEGYYNHAYGESSHAEGHETESSGANSHAEGQSTVASKIGSHAEGSSTTASGDYSHAEGVNTTASGNTAHAEGSQSTASGTASHAEGNSVASGGQSHAEGRSSYATGGYSHAENSYTHAENENAHTEGFSTVAFGKQAHAEGTYMIAYGENSHAEGISDSWTLYRRASLTSGGSSGLYNLSGADANIVPGMIIRDVDGDYTKKAYIVDKPTSTSILLNTSIGELSNKQVYFYYGTVGKNAHAENYCTLAINDNSHAEGQFTITSNEAAHAEGSETRAGGFASHAEGAKTIAQHDGAHVEGLWTISGSPYQHVAGQYNLLTSGLEVIGNGVGDSSRSNARTLDTQGNEWLAGTLRIGGVDYTTGEEVATQSYADRMHYISYNRAISTSSTTVSLGNTICVTTSATAAFTINTIFSNNYSSTVFLVAPNTQCTLSANGDSYIMDGTTTTTLNGSLTYTDMVVGNLYEFNILCLTNGGKNIQVVVRKDWGVMPA